jgi:hypothetical protein
MEDNNSDHENNVVWRLRSKSPPYRTGDYGTSAIKAINQDKDQTIQRL